MKGKVILFDIDGTLFDSSSFLKDFYKSLIDEFNISSDNLDAVKKIYIKNKKENGYFLPSTFLKKIANRFTSIKLNLLNKTFWNVDLFEKNLYKDSSIIKDLSRVAVIGIFSKGDYDFQKQKISFIADLLDGENIYIFSNKIGRIDEVLENYLDYQIYMIDNQMDVLEKAKDLFPNISTVLIDRNKSSEEDKDIIKIKTLNELKSIIYD